MKEGLCIFFTSFQQAVGVSVLQQVAVDGDIVQGLQGRALLHVFVGHRETGLGAVTHQTTTTKKRCMSKQMKCEEKNKAQKKLEYKCFGRHVNSELGLIYDALTHISVERIMIFFK